MPSKTLKTIKPTALLSDIRRDVSFVLGRPYTEGLITVFSSRTNGFLLSGQLIVQNVFLGILSKSGPGMSGHMRR